MSLGLIALGWVGCANPEPGIREPERACFRANQAWITCVTDAWPPGSERDAALVAHLHDCSVFAEDTGGVFLCAASSMQCEADEVSAVRCDPAAVEALGSVWLDCSWTCEG